MTRILIPAVVLVAALMTAPAMAQDLARMYVGAGVTDGTVNVTNGDDKSLGSINAVVGLELVDFLGVELQFGAASDQQDSLLSEPLVQYQAAMLRLGYRRDQVGVYLLGGQARLDIDDRFNNSNAGLAIGAGLNLFGSNNVALNFHVLDFDDGAFRTATIGFQYYLGGYR